MFSSEEICYENKLVKDMFDSLEKVEHYPIPISDNHKLIDSFFDKLTNLSHKIKTRNASKLKILVNGMYGYGKSHIINCMFGQEVAESSSRMDSVSILPVVYSQKHADNIELCFIDTPGLEPDKKLDHVKYKILNTIYTERPDVIWYVVLSNYPILTQDEQDQLRLYQEYNIPVVFVLNKSDSRYVDHNLNEWKKYMSCHCFRLVYTFCSLLYYNELKNFEDPYFHDLISQTLNLLEIQNSSLVNSTKSHNLCVKSFSIRATICAATCHPFIEWPSQVVIHKSMIISICSIYDLKLAEETQSILIDSLAQSLGIENEYHGLSKIISSCFEVDSDLKIISSINLPKIFHLMATFGLSLGNTLRYFAMTGRYESFEFVDMFLKQFNMHKNLSNDKLRQILSGQSFEEFKTCNEIVIKSNSSRFMSRPLRRTNLSGFCLICFSARAKYRQNNCGHVNYCESCYLDEVSKLPVQNCPKCSNIYNNNTNRTKISKKSISLVKPLIYTTIFSIGAAINTEIMPYKTWPFFLLIQFGLFNTINYLFHVNNRMAMTWKKYVLSIVLASNLASYNFIGMEYFGIKRKFLAHFATTSLFGVSIICLLKKLTRTELDYSELLDWFTLRRLRGMTLKDNNPFNLNVYLGNIFNENNNDGQFDFYKDKCQMCLINRAKVFGYCDNCHKKMTE